MKRVFGIVFVIAAVAAGFAACKQGKGDRCQINQDCQTGLVCSSATGTCVVAGTTNELDAPIVDAPKIDAAKDAPADTTVADVPLD